MADFMQKQEINLCPESLRDVCYCSLSLTRSTEVMSGNNAVMLAQKVSYSQAGVLLNLRSNTTLQKMGIFNN